MPDIDDNIELDASKLSPATKLGEEVIRQFRRAVMHRGTIRAGDYKLDELLNECYMARDDQTTCQEQELRDNYPEWAAMPVSIVSFKVGILISLIRESLAGVAGAPFIVDTTPNPEIPKEVRDRVVAELAQDLTETVRQAQLIDPLAEPDEEMIMSAIKSRKAEVLYEVREHAKEQAIILQDEIHDKTVQGGYRDAIIEFADDFATYPFACIHGPYPVYEEDTVWDGSDFVEEKKMVWRFERVSPFDLFWTEDCTNTQDGTALFIRKSVPYNYLADALELAEAEEEDDNKVGDKDDGTITATKRSGYVKRTIKDVLEMAENGELPRRWVDFFYPNPETNTSPVKWQNGDTIDMLIRYGRFLGKDLKEMGFTGLEKHRAYETKVVVVAGHIVQCHINRNPSKYKRPVFTASFERRNSSIVGKGLAQRLLPIHKAYRACITLAMHNLGLSVEPITELDINRVLEYMPDEWIDDPHITPGQVIPADGDRTGNSGRAVKFTEVPNITTQAIRMAEYIMEQAHSISNIPAALHGQPVGSGANRTVRGLLTLQGNTLKPIQSSLINLDIGVIEPMVQLLYRLLVIYDDDFEYTGDAKIVAKGAASMIEKEMEKQEAMENMQILGQIGDKVSPAILDRAVKKLLLSAGIIEPGEEISAEAPIAPTAPQGGIPEVPGIPGQPPQDPIDGPQMPPLPDNLPQPPTP